MDNSPVGRSFVGVIKMVVVPVELKGSSKSPSANSHIKSTDAGGESDVFS